MVAPMNPGTGTQLIRLMPAHTEAIIMTARDCQNLLLSNPHRTMMRLISKWYRTGA